MKSSNLKDKEGGSIEYRCVCVTTDTNRNAFRHLPYLVVEGIIQGTQEERSLRCNS